MNSIETKVADAILQRAKQVTICGKTFEVTPPTPATLILVSEQVGTLPIMATADDEKLANTIVRTAKDYKVIGLAVATLILGAKRIKQNKKIGGIFGLFGAKTELQWLADKLMEECTIEEISNIVGARLEDMQIAHFFALTTFLSGTNVTKATREVETASGE